MQTTTLKEKFIQKLTVKIKKNKFYVEQAGLW